MPQLVDTEKKEKRENNSTSLSFPTLLVSSTSFPLRVATRSPACSARLSGGAAVRRGGESRVRDVQSRVGFSVVVSLYAFMALFASMAFLFLYGWSPVNRSSTGASSSSFCRWNPWWIACRAEEDQGRFNKSVCRISYFTNREWIFVPPAGRGGEGRNCCCLVRWLSLHLGAPHVVAVFGAAIYGHRAGCSSTSTRRPSRSGASARRHDAFKWFVPGSIVSAGVRGRSPEGRVRASCSKDLGGDAWRSPAICGRDALGSDCSSSYCSRVLFVNARSFSSNSRSFRARVVKGPLCKLYLPPGINEMQQRGP